MSKIKLTLPNNETPVTGKQVTFTAPCDCTSVECIQINDVDYAVVDAMGNTLAGGSSVWAGGSLLTVVLDVENTKAYLQNPAGNKVPKVTNTIAITLPAGRVRGDVDGDGMVTVADSEIIMTQLTGGASITDSIQLWCADINNDGEIDIKDTRLIGRVAEEGYEKIGLYGNDYTGNWIANPNYETELGQFYTDIAVEGILATDNICLGDYTGRVTNFVVTDGSIRVFVTIPPIADTSVNLFIFEGSESKTVVASNGSTFLGSVSRGGDTMIGNLVMSGGADILADASLSMIGSVDHPFQFAYLRGVEFCDSKGSVVGRIRNTTSKALQMVLGLSGVKGTLYIGSLAGGSICLETPSVDSTVTVTLPSNAGTLATVSSGTDDLTAGTSELATGALYFVYE